MPSIELRNITKSFDGEIANNSVSLSVEPGSIHALVGENGAGKTTLMKTLYGMYQPDQGDIIVGGEKRRFFSPSDALQSGIGMVHQHFMLVPTLTVMENVILGCEPVSGLGFIDVRVARKRLKVLTSEYRFDVEIDTKIEDLSVGQQQRVEILKLLYRETNVLILDEPTPVLTPQEITELFGILRSLRRQGRTIILITHKLHEVMQLCDRVTVMRHGIVVGERDIASTNESELARLMVGKDLSPMRERSITQHNDPALVVKNVSVSSQPGSHGLHDINFSVDRGEILGIAGIEGNGQSTLVELITGMKVPDSGTIRIDGAPIKSTSVSHIPDDRQKYAIVPEFSVAENYLLGRQRDDQFCRTMVIDKHAIGSFAESCIRQFGVRLRNQSQLIHTLSGGNQQRVVLGRELSKRALLIVANQPTRGLDIGAIEFVRNAIIDERNSGKAIILISSDLDELMMLADRIAVMHAGRIVHVGVPGTLSTEVIGLLMGGTRTGVET